MASIEAVDIVRLGASDAARALPLSVEAGWNQTVDDWRFLLEHGTTFGVAKHDRLVATALASPLGSALNWISMVLVTRDWRGHGLGTRLLKRCIEQASPSAAGLDATELGRPIYLPLGFRDLYRISRYRLERSPAPAAPPAGIELRPIQPADMQAIAAWDSERSGMQRAPILNHLQARMPHLAWAAWRGDQLVGYCLGRDGRLATQIGPVVADDATVAIALTACAMTSASAPFFVDAVDGQSEYCRWLEHNGAVAPRFFIRMVLGDAPGLDKAASIYAIGGPELG
ncbi:MAG: GNAT family N-acetyltransferase [Rhodospirillales bacterium]